MKLMDDRSSGVLLHVTALAGGEGIGDIGASARRFVDWLEQAGQSWWQVLPCTPTGFGDSPYQSPSAYAGNPLLISLRELVSWQVLSSEEVDAVTDGVSGKGNSWVDFDWVREQKQRLLHLVCERFDACAPEQIRAEFAAFCAAKSQFWLHDYARFCVLKNRYSAAAWQFWPAEYALRDATSLERFDERETKAMAHIKLQQFIFTQQWRALRAYAAERGVGLVGDCPIYVATDSADVWAHPELFDLTENGQPRVVAGVPPDYFSATGQLWGNPLYRWDRMRADEFAWWRARVRHCARYFDVTRIDHFRGFEAYWEVPGDAPDASHGRWQPGPGEQLLGALQEEDVQLIAEDLGDLTESVHELRRQFGLPGMRVLQFGFDGGDDNPHAPERIGEDVICYVGTHDNNTTLGWYADLDAAHQTDIKQKLGVDTPLQLLTALINLALQGPAPLCVLTMQDLLAKDGESRFNTPGTVGGNWRWRMGGDDLSNSAGVALGAELFQRTQEAGRVATDSVQTISSKAAQTAY